MALACSDLGISPPLGGRSFNGDGERVRRRGTEEKRKGSRSDFFFPFLVFFFPLRSGWLPGRLGWTGPARADQETESVNYCIIPAFYVHYIRSSKSNRI